METKEYIVSLKRGVDYSRFWNEIENESDNDGLVPSRRVDIVNNRDASLRQCHYSLTDEEADLLRQDPRIYSVELPTQFTPYLFSTQVDNFTKTALTSGNFVNWGLRRCISETNPYGTSTTATNEYSYCLDGTGVDVVIQDSGIEVNHPEFLDDNGISRVQEIDWFAESGVTGTMNVNHYSDYDGHGTHVAGIAAGKHYGWAKQSKIYSVKVAGLEGGSDASGIDIPSCFDVIIGWHNNKPVDPATGVKRPTIVNMSWGYGTNFANIDGGMYRGTPWSGSEIRNEYGMVGVNTGFGFRHGVRVDYIDVSIQEMIDAGIHVCIAAGNSYQKIDIPAGLDYNNYYNNTIYGPVYYNRGSSPYDDEAFIVGSIDSDVYSSSYEQKSVFSESGPGVNVYAPGSYIMSCTSTENRFTDGDYSFFESQALPIDLLTSDMMVSSNSYIAFNKIVQTLNDYSPANIGPALVIGSEPYPTQIDSTYTQLYTGAGFNNKSNTIRFEGQSSYNNPSSSLIWETTFWDNNWIEILLVAHTDATQEGTVFRLQNSTSVVVDMSQYFKSGLGTTPVSCVLTTEDNGITWVPHYGYSVSLVDGVYSLVNSVALEKTGLTPNLGGSPVDEGFFRINTFFSFSAGTYTVNPWKQTNISGTSMASPQVCGVGALLLQMEPKLTPNQLQTRITSYAVDALFSTGLDNDYTNHRSIKGSNNRTLYLPFNSNDNLVFTGALSITKAS